MEDIKSIIAKNISELRISRGMTQLELAEKLHYSDKAVSKWERGESVPEISTLVAIAELFEVTLDYLVKEEHEQQLLPALEVSTYISNQRKKKNRSVITAVAVLSVWFAAILSYMIIDMASSGSRFHWLAIIYAVPVCAIVWLIFNSIWFNRRRNYFIISLIVWGIIASVYISLIVFRINVWQLFILGVPAQLVIMLCSLIRSGKSENKA